MKFNSTTIIPKSLYFSVVGLLVTTVGTPVLAFQSVRSPDVSNRSISSEKSSADRSVSTTGELPVQLAQGKKNCRYNDNLNVLADNFIGKCCKGSIRGEFPTQFLTEDLDFIKRASKVNRSAKKAYKLLNDGRFRK